MLPVRPCPDRKRCSTTVCNVLQLRGLFGASTDYLLHNTYDSDRDIHQLLGYPLSGCQAGFGALADFALYVMSWFVEVPVPAVSMENGQVVTYWSGMTDYSWEYFLKRYNQELLVTFSFLLILAGGLTIVFSPLGPESEMQTPPEMEVPEKRLILPIFSRLWYTGGRKFYQKEGSSNETGTGPARRLHRAAGKRNSLL